MYMLTGMLLLTPMGVVKRRHILKAKRRGGGVDSRHNPDGCALADMAHDERTGEKNKSGIPVWAAGIDPYIQTLLAQPSPLLCA